VIQHLALNPGFPDILFEPWQLVTYSFLHLGPGFGGLLHILFNMLWMVWIGRDYASTFGSARVFAIYMYGAIGGALLTVILHGAFPGVRVFGGPVQGASAAVLAIMMTVAVEFPEKAINLLFIGVVRLIHVVIAFIALDILFLASGNTSVSAHLGGVAAGFLFARGARAGLNLTGWAEWVFPPSGRSMYGGGAIARARERTHRARSEGGGPSMLERLEGWLGSRGSAGEDQAEDSSGRRGAVVHDIRTGEPSGKKADEHGAEVDRILDKISESGYDSLTEKEKRTLFEAGQKGE
jgi:membrane associated rhomboid family serine protease